MKARRAPARLQGLAPVVDPATTRLLVLGSFPSVASLQAQQYYGHPRNQFWPLLGAWWGVPLATWPYDERLRWVRAHGLGIWDVYASCHRPGSLDADIRDAAPNDLVGLVARLPRLALIAHNGSESARAMRVTRTLGVPVCRLPSTSPANASWSFERKRAAWAQAFGQAGLLG
ncbi:MAG: DNA-deoxyinosine glycosylase [Rubrivivax sp.]